MATAVAAAGQVGPHLAEDRRVRDDFQRIDPPAGEWAIAPNTSMAADGSVILSWLERADIPPAQQEEDAEYAGNGGAAIDASPTWRLRFARFADSAWSEPRTVTEGDDFFANWADLPRVTQTDDGVLLAHWLQSSGPHVFAYDIILARSTDGGETWTTLGPAHDDGTKTEHGFVSAVREAADRPSALRLFWLDGRETSPLDPDEHDSHGHAHDHGHGDMQLRTALFTDSIGESELLDARVCECCDTDAAMTSAGPIVVYRDRTEGEVRDISIVRRVDGAWTDPKPVHEDGWGISGCPVNGPMVAAVGRRVAVAWYTGADFEGRVQVAFSDDAGATFAGPIVLERDAALGRVDVALSRAGEALVIWLASDAYGGVIRAHRVTEAGPVGEPMRIARTNPGRQSGFPKLELIDDDRALVVWTHADRPSRLRAAVVGF